MADEDMLRAVYNLALQVTGDRAAAEDAAQEAFLALAKESGGLRDPKAAKAWLMKAVVRICWKEKARERRRRRLEREAAMGQGKEEGFEEELVAAVRSAVDDLPEALRLPVLLRYDHGLSYEEIAEVADCPVGSVSARLRDGLDAVRKGLPAALALLALADLEKALGAVPSEPVPVTLAASLEGMGRGSSLGTGGILMAMKGKTVAAAGVALILLGFGGWGLARRNPPAPGASSSILPAPGRSGTPAVVGRKVPGEGASPSIPAMAPAAPSAESVERLKLKAFHLLMEGKLKEIGELSGSEPWAFEVLASMLEDDAVLADCGGPFDWERNALSAKLAEALGYGPAPKRRALGLSLVRDARGERLAWGLALLRVSWGTSIEAPDPELQASLRETYRALCARGPLERRADLTLSAVLWALGDEETPKRLLAAYQDPRLTEEERGRAEFLARDRLRGGQPLPQAWQEALERRFLEMRDTGPNDLEPGSEMTDGLGRRFTSESGDLPNAEKGALAVELAGVSPAARAYLEEDLRKRGLDASCLEAMGWYGDLWRGRPEIARIVEGLSREVLAARDLRKLHVLTRAMREVPGDPREMAAWYASLAGKTVGEGEDVVDAQDAMLGILRDAGVPCLRALRDLEADPARRLRIDYVLAEHGDAAAAAQVASALEAPSTGAPLRMQGVTALLRQGRPVEGMDQVVKRVVEDLSKAPCDLSYELMQWIRTVPPGEPRNALARLLWDAKEDAGVRLRMVESVPVRENPWLRDALLGMTREGEPWSRLGAASRLVRGGEAEAGLPVLLEQARAHPDGVPLLRVYHDLGWISGRGNVQAREGLYHLLEEPGSARYWSAVTLGKLGDKRAVPALRELLDTPAPKSVGPDNGYDSCIDIPKALEALGDEDLKRRYRASGRSE